MSQEIKNQVSAILEQAGITYSVVYRGERRKALDGNSTMDEWEATFSRVVNPRQLPGTIAESFDYFTGLGHRKASRKPHSWEAGNCARLTVAQWEKENAKPVAPNAANVLYYLILDAAALDTSFDYWCSDYGYDTDSRKAFDTYMTCCENGKKLRRVIDRETLAKLQDALQDY